MDTFSLGKVFAEGAKPVAREAYLPRITMVKKEGDSSALANLLDRIPSDPGQVQEMASGGGAKIVDKYSKPEKTT